jgi:hypothetical protein
LLCVFAVQKRHLLGIFAQAGEPISSCTSRKK